MSVRFPNDIWIEAEALLDARVRVVEETLLPWAKRLTGNTADAEDLVQDTFLWMLQWVRPPYRSEDIQACFFRSLGLGFFYPPTKSELEEAGRRVGWLLKLLAGEPEGVRWAFRVQRDVWRGMHRRGYFGRDGCWQQQVWGRVTNPDASLLLSRRVDQLLWSDPEVALALAHFSAGDAEQTGHPGRKRGRAGKGDVADSLCLEEW